MASATVDAAAAEHNQDRYCPALLCSIPFGTLLAQVPFNIASSSPSFGLFVVYSAWWLVSSCRSLTFLAHSLSVVRAICGSGLCC